MRQMALRTYGIQGTKEDRSAPRSAGEIVKRLALLTS